MSNLVWPNLPGQTRIETDEADAFDTTIVRTVNGLEDRTIWPVSADGAPEQYFYLIVKARTGTAAPAPWQGYSEYEIVRKWFKDHQGAGDSFLFDDNGTQVRVRFESDRLPRRRLAAGLYRFDVTFKTTT